MAKASSEGTGVTRPADIAFGFNSFPEACSSASIRAWAPTLAGARDKAYAAVDKLCFEGMHFRRDIAAKGLK